jgi:hypothetical protein
MQQFRDYRNGDGMTYKEHEEAKISEANGQEAYKTNEKKRKRFEC